MSRKAFCVHSLQEANLFPSLLQSPSKAGQRWLSGLNTDDGLEDIRDVLLGDWYHTRDNHDDPILPVQARAQQRPHPTRRWKPVSLPVADSPVEIEQLVNVVRTKGNSPDLEKCLDALSIRVKSFHVSKTLSSVDDAESTIRFLAWASEQPKFSLNLYTCVTLVIILARAKQFDKIWELLSELHVSGFQLEDSLFNITIKAYGNMGNCREAIRTLHRMQEFGVLPTAYSYNTLLSVLLKSQKLNLAMEIYHELLQVPHINENVFSHAMIISALCDVGRLEEAHKVAMGGLERGIPLNNVTWTSLINGFCKAGDIDKGVELFSMMADMGLEPTVVTYSAIIAGFCKIGKLRDAMRYLDRMQSDGVRPNAITYTPLLDAFCKAGQIDEGHELLKKSFADGSWGNTIQYSIFVVAYSKSGRIDEACAMYDEMVKDGRWPNAATYASLIQGLCNAERLTKALKIFDEMKERTCGPNAAIYKVMIEALSRAGLKGKAGKMFKEMLEEGYEGTESTCKGLIKCLGQQGSLDTAKETLRMMLKTNWKATPLAINTFFKGLCDASQVDSAYQFLMEISEGGFAPTAQTYNILAHKAFKAGDFEKALSLFSDMENKGVDPDIYTYAALFQAAWKAKKVDTLLNMYHDMRKRRVHVNPFVFTILVKALCTLDKVPEACKVCSQIFEDGFESSDGNEQASYLEDRNFVKIQVFLPLLIHLQHCGNVKRMVSLWESILKNGLFSWDAHTDNDSMETLE